MYNQDLWFIRAGNTYHASYLLSMRCLDKKGQMGHVGHATSHDLIHWTDQGPVIAPQTDTWNDDYIAASSVAALAGKYWMVYTGYGRNQRGIGLAVADDLMEWKKVGDKPVAPLGDAITSTWNGKLLTWKAVADP